ncbi:hypothetical protein FSP39_012408 [Pinctada imbricata]|uniref:Uncharacterized protein n=1 Tax=Pinctada imbricata TaxID=66713 RepID=A0AA88XWF9_PINIB|nr:hypothetical protein FSP39_012408 [Pinctada imbricata]
MFQKKNSETPLLTKSSSAQLMDFPSPTEADDSSLLTRLRNGYQLGRPALVKKTGQYRVTYKGLKKYRSRFVIHDLYQSMIDLKWRWAILFFCLAFFLVYFVFAVIWYLLAHAHGDFSNLDNPNWVPCIEHMRNFADALLYSIETQTTIGYGTLYPNTNCGGSVLIVFVQITIGFLLETILVGFMLVKIARPKHRRQTLLFSEKACICKENGELCLDIRAGDMRQSHLVDTKVFGMFITERVSAEGVVYPLYQQQMDFEAQGMDDRVFMMWPMILKHKINANSPLFNLSVDEVLSNTFEIIVILEGTIEATGEICQARTSYSSKDILWGYRFVNLIDFDEGNGQWRTNFKLFNDVAPTPTPKCSGKELADIYKGTGSSDEDSKSKRFDRGGMFRRSQSQMILSPSILEETEFGKK